MLPKNFATIRKTIWDFCKVTKIQKNTMDFSLCIFKDTVFIVMEVLAVTMDYPLNGVVRLNQLIQMQNQ